MRQQTPKQSIPGSHDDLKDDRRAMKSPPHRTATARQRRLNVVLGSGTGVCQSTRSDEHAEQQRLNARPLSATEVHLARILRLRRPFPRMVSWPCIHFACPTELAASQCVASMVRTEGRELKMRRRATMLNDWYPKIGTTNNRGRHRHVGAHKRYQRAPASAICLSMQFQCYPQ